MDHNESSNTSTVWILSVRCDGREECYQGEDEAGCEEDQSYSSWAWSALKAGKHAVSIVSLA